MAIPAHWTAGRSAAKEQFGLPERMELWMPIDAGERPGTVKPKRRDRPAALSHTPEVREAKGSVDKKARLRTALTTCLRLVQADYRVSTPGTGCHLSTNSVMTPLRARAWTAGQVRLVANEMASEPGSLRFGSCHQDTDYFGNRRRRGCPDSECLASNRARRPGCPAVYPILQPAVWNPVVFRRAHPVVLPDDNRIVPLASTYWTYLLFRHCAQRIAPERFVPD